MWIYRAHIIMYTSNALNTLTLVEEQCLQELLACRLSAAKVSELVWNQVPDRGSSDDNARRPSCYVDGVVWSAGNDVQNIVADDWRCLGLEHSSLPDTAMLCCRDIGGLLYTKLVLDPVCHIEPVQVGCTICDSPRTHCLEAALLKRNASNMPSFVIRCQQSIFID